MARVRGDEQVEGRDGTPVGRRAVLGLLGLGAVGVAFGSGAESWLAKQVGKISAKDPTGLSGLVPGGGGFRIYTVTAGYPSKSREDYRLKVTGLVDEPATLTYDDLLALPQTRLTKDFQCVTGWRVEDVHWQGVTLADLLDHVGAKAGAKYLHFTSFDGAYTESLTMEQARRPDVIVAHHMLGEPVTKEHGGPVRLYVAPMYGYKSCKWLDGIEVSDNLRPGYWEALGYDTDAWVGKSNGRDERADLMADRHLERFDIVERALHWVNAALVLGLLFTGLAMYWSPMTQLVGRRALMEDIHLVCGLLLPVPFLLVLAGRWRRGFVRDARRLGRFLDDDWRWLRRRFRRGGSLRLGKFNAGQKINVILVAGVLPLMLLSGSIMQWNGYFSDRWRTGATFVHDWGFLILLIVVIGHIGKALGEPEQLRAMLRGWVPASWAKVHRPRWYDEVAGRPADPAAPGPRRPDRDDDPADEAVVEAG